VLTVVCDQIPCGGIQFEYRTKTLLFINPIWQYSKRRLIPQVQLPGDVTHGNRNRSDRQRLRVGVVGGGCSGFQYSMAFENASGMMDKVFTYDGLKVFIDATSLMYLNNCVVDYVETFEAAGFKFENPNVKSTCGCGSSFSV
jgi:iron-sulfur cluster assembly accessory protein